MPPYFRGVHSIHPPALPAIVFLVLVFLKFSLFQVLNNLIYSILFQTEIGGPGAGNPRAGPESFPESRPAPASAPAGLRCSAHGAGVGVRDPAPSERARGEHVGRTRAHTCVREYVSASVCVFNKIGCRVCFKSGFVCRSSSVLSSC